MSSQKTAWLGPGEKPHEYKPDWIAQGDCAICGHTRDAHHVSTQSAPSSNLLDLETEADNAVR
ncbi:hypothetical protein ROE7235_03872 [Roseibaca ekhonensis]|uniref:Uncharacterized protein n=1 Tax=Roseinatronobacter ekhonensis TaxID=254356 RepID=A0A3B0MF71_9RHOB|nr:hypothetical protein ROE7235_03872 [Roseibaca ekhonensis]